jgi:hypothetical protein
LIRNKMREHHQEEGVREKIKKTTVREKGNEVGVERERERERGEGEGMKEKDREKVQIR